MTPNLIDKILKLISLTLFKVINTGFLYFDGKYILQLSEKEV